MNARPVVALLTDFGTRDHYVGAVKGAVLAVCPDAAIVDLTHEVTAHDVREGAFVLAAAYPTFPIRTVFVGVVDPGVGTDRRGIAVEVGGRRFVGPDNGLFSYVLADHPEALVHQITNAGLFRSEISPTFHARDIFGPVAGHLAAGTPLDRVGPIAPAPVLLPLPRVEARPGERWEAVVAHVDRFGNLTTNLTRIELAAIVAGMREGANDVVIEVAGKVLPLVRTYADVPEGDACALIGGSDRLEVGVNRGSAEKLLGASRGTPVTVRRA